MQKISTQFVAFLLVFCFLTEPIAAANTFQTTESPRHFDTFLTCAITPELAIAERVKMYSLGLAGSLTGFRHRILTLSRRLPSDVKTRATLIVGDLDGHWQNLLNILKDAQYVSTDGTWSAGDSILIQMGDATARSIDSPETYRLLRSLQTQAAAKGGRVIRLMGNHEWRMMIGNPEPMDAASMGTAALALGEKIKTDLALGNLQIAALVGNRIVTHAGISTSIFPALLDEVRDWRRDENPEFGEVSPSDIVEFLNLGGREFAKGNTRHPAVSFVKNVVGLSWYTKSESTLFPKGEPQITAHNTLAEISFIDKNGWVIGTDVGIGMPDGRSEYLFYSNDRDVLQSILLKTQTTARLVKTLTATPEGFKPFSFVATEPVDPSLAKDRETRKRADTLVPLTLAGVAAIAIGSSIALPPTYLLPFALAMMAGTMSAAVSYHLLSQTRGGSLWRKALRWGLVVNVWAVVILGVGAVFKFVHSHHELHLTEMIRLGAGSMSFAFIIPVFVHIKSRSRQSISLQRAS